MYSNWPLPRPAEVYVSSIPDKEFWIYRPFYLSLQKKT